MKTEVTSIFVSVLPNGHFDTTIYFLNSSGNTDAVSRSDMSLQGVEEFIRNFRIQHKL